MGIVATLKPKRCLSGAVLKNIALFAMLLDHVNKVVLHPRLSLEIWKDWFWISRLCDIVGRFAFPIFFFLLVEGLFHTKNRGKYLRNLLLFALISEVPYNLFFSRAVFFPGAQNIFFTLALSMGTLWLVESIRGKVKWWVAPAFCLVGAACLIAYYLKFDYLHYGVLISTAFYLLRDYRFLATIGGYLAAYNQWWSLPAFLLINCYNGERGRQWKWLSYWFYPAHLLVLGVFRLLTI